MDNPQVPRIELSTATAHMKNWNKDLFSNYSNPIFS